MPHIAEVFDRWGRRLSCALCGADLRREKWTARPRIYCSRPECQYDANRRRHGRPLKFFGEG